MRLRSECGVWEIFAPGLAPGDVYEYGVDSLPLFLAALRDRRRA